MRGDVSTAYTVAPACPHMWEEPEMSYDLFSSGKRLYHRDRLSKRLLSRHTISQVVKHFSTWVANCHTGKQSSLIRRPRSGEQSGWRIRYRSQWAGSEWRKSRGNPCAQCITYFLIPTCDVARYLIICACSVMTDAFTGKALSQNVLVDLWIWMILQSCEVISWHHM